MIAAVQWYIYSLKVYIIPLASFVNTFCLGHRSVLCHPWVMGNSFSWSPKYWQPVGFLAQSTNVAITGNRVDSTAQCPYANFFDPFEILPGTVTNLTII